MCRRDFTELLRFWLKCEPFVLLFPVAMANERRTEWRRTDVFLFSMEVTLKTLLYWCYKKLYSIYAILKSRGTSKSSLVFSNSVVKLEMKEGTILIFLCHFHDRPQGKSYLFFTQFKAEIKGAKIEYATAYVSIIAIRHYLTPPQWKSETLSSGYDSIWRNLCVS